MFVKTGDKVKVIAGKEKGKEGTVIRVDRKNDRVVVKGLNMIKKHEKPSQTNQNGGVVEKEGSIHVSNVMLIDPESGKPTRIGHEIVDGNKVRIAKVSGKAIDKK
ncbi:50S ribosomal protein L24 [Lactobacillus mulieris]|jgi:ribosomal protein L24|uniref:Large ribosomal subunit protein uL24 n=1 Tax=Lactobacillus mulieris TaxID=2508708 RepID=A0AAP3M4B4_9LACO|nr:MULTISPECIES: 50S ribosomal protein L24 [Lactobacillus]EEU20649.1 ribosomal protein L24 [Lactobacillus jensenii 27-2-CHN]EEX23816.1 ribosomal protein L24 [Lactobacillus jensenii 115-3-CHN]EFH29953.1 ribosomal protein L24 [Lactobacillus jensenii JV-V16]KAA9245592.1 50S ribosomal protein L24 [Lactobacillus jensenii]KAA9369093.1 50S ribosomal protein L24 [Lactobacillus jensenii]